MAEKITLPGFRTDATYERAYGSPEHVTAITGRGTSRFGTPIDYRMELTEYPGSADRLPSNLFERRKAVSWYELRAWQREIMRINQSSNLEITTEGYRDEPPPEEPPIPLLPAIPDILPETIETPEKPEEPEIDTIVTAVQQLFDWLAKK